MNKFTKRRRFQLSRLSHSPWIHFLLVNCDEQCTGTTNRYIVVISIQCLNLLDDFN